MPETVRDLPDDTVFVDDTDEVQAILTSAGVDPDAYDALFVDTEDGEYAHLYGMTGTVPHRDRPVTRII